MRGLVAKVVDIYSTIESSKKAFFIDPHVLSDLSYYGINRAVSANLVPKMTGYMAPQANNIVNKKFVSY
ncbi:MAG: hypothetical protein AB8W37_04020 [Arsenophonus endosymbiont of Dermacentor nuttalli]